jgi:two-component system nitrogen regulation response regulator NtrX
MQELSREHGRRPRIVDDEAMEQLRGYPWPGNVRELRNVLERLLIMVPGERVESRHLSFLQGGLTMDVASETPTGPNRLTQF